ncbi:hypothetical protein AVEN_61981-1 [Araneus ventricosus]|uniref:Uncharacterized protein n=1 Tax=Araneus ventricosus TaxID=182803 RepID=A0A4Y2J8R1_ARAVE|nr:hypothetical protein AVEN_61981-1 [Araneus ventricosus]
MFPVSRFKDMSQNKTFRDSFSHLCVYSPKLNGTNFSALGKSCKSLMFISFLKKKITLEVSSRSPRINLHVELSDAEMVLSMSLTEILAVNVKSRIEDVIVCNGCIENQANQPDFYDDLRMPPLWRHHLQRVKASRILRLSTSFTSNKTSNRLLA